MQDFALYFKSIKSIKLNEDSDFEELPHQVYRTLFQQVNEKSCRLRMGAYRDSVKRKGDKIEMGL